MQNNKCKLEKADILELTVKYVKKLHYQVEDSSSTATSSDRLDTSKQSYLTGFSDCVRQIIDFVADISDLSFRDSLQSHLNQCLFSIQSNEQTSASVVVDGSNSTLSFPTNSSSSSGPFSTSFCITPPSPAPSAESNLSSSSSASLSPECLTLPLAPLTRSLKRQFSDDEGEASDEDEQDCFNTSGPINLSKMSKGVDATWRPW